MNRPVGLLGGTFDPVHAGHLRIAVAARDALGLERVWLLPAHRSPLRPEGARATPAERAEMCRLAAASQPGLDVCDLELRRAPPSYTFDTLTELRRLHPGVPWTWVAGADTALQLAAWSRYAELLELCAFAFVSRPGVDRGLLQAALAELRAAGGRVQAIEIDGVDVSASEVRRRAAAGLPLRGLVPDAVADYIERRGLYRS